MRRHASFLLLLLCLVIVAPQQTAARGRKVDKTATSGYRHLNDNFALYDSLQKCIFRFAETGYNEYRSSELMCEFLEQNGFTVERGVADIPTAFVATYGSGKPVIGMLAEYDALPGMSQDTVPYKKPFEGSVDGHACGHNVLGMASVAGAVAVSKWLAEGHVGTVKVFGCPAEEGGGGKAYMTREGCFDGVDAVFDWHPNSKNVINVATGLANVRVRFEFTGVSAHASMAPEKGRSALDAVEAFDYMVNMMREHVPSDSRIHYVITNGGEAPNVVPDKAEVLYYFRHPQRTVVGDIFERAIKAAEGAAMGTGTTMKYEIMSGNYERLPNHVLAELFDANLHIVGGVNYDEREREFALELMKNSGVTDTSIMSQASKVLDYKADSGFSGSSSDVGNVTWVVPVGSLLVASFVPGCGGGHCWQQTAAVGTTIGTKAMLNVARVFYLSAYDIFNDPSIAEAAKAELDSVRGEDFVFKPLIGDRRPPLDYCRPASR